MPTPEVPQGWVRARQTLLSEMKAALGGSPPGSVNLSRPKHGVTAPCLWELAYDASLAGKVLDVRWSDGSRSPFPCGGLSIAEGAIAPLPATFRLGLMSFRHPELDYLVDLYACRNRELVAVRSMAAEEEYSFSRACEIIGDPALAAGTLVEVFHTGLEPMVVGFYRGVATVLEKRARQKLPRSIQLQPMLYPGKPQLHNLTPASDGAKIENYIRCKVWM